jgi:hypothetical protein
MCRLTGSSCCRFNDPGHTVVTNLLADDFVTGGNADNLVFEAAVEREEPSAPGVQGERIIGDMCSADWWLESQHALRKVLQKHKRRNSDTAVLMPLIFYSDKTELDGGHRRKQNVLYVTTACLREGIRSSDRGWVPIAILPIAESPDGSDRCKAFTRWLHHECLRIVFRQMQHDVVYGLQSPIGISGLQTNTRLHPAIALVLQVPPHPTHTHTHTHPSNHLCALLCSHRALQDNLEGHMYCSNRIGWNVKRGCRVCDLPTKSFASVHHRADDNGDVQWTVRSGDMSMLACYGSRDGTHVPATDAELAEYSLWRTEVLSFCNCTACDCTAHVVACCVAAAADRFRW